MHVVNDDWRDDVQRKLATDHCYSPLSQANLARRSFRFIDGDFYTFTSLSTSPMMDSQITKIDGIYIYQIMYTYILKVPIK